MCIGKYFAYIYVRVWSQSLSKLGSKEMKGSHLIHRMAFVHTKVLLDVYEGLKHLYKSL